MALYYKTPEAQAAHMCRLRQRVQWQFLGWRLAIMTLIWLVVLALRLLTPLSPVVLLSVAFAAGCVTLVVTPPDLRDETGLRNIYLDIESQRLKKHLVLARVSLLALQSLGAALWLSL